MVEIKNLYKTYNSKGNSVEALRGINLKIRDGEVYGIIGLSGAGKSSLVRCINLLEKPTSGEIFVDGVDLTKANGEELRQSRKKIGMVFQHFNLLMNKTVFENVAFPMKISKFSKEEIHCRVNELLDLVGLSDKADMFPAQLSGGQKQRVGIARAISAKPSLIMCDEATSALDPTTTKSILELLKEINAKLNITIVIITHEMEVIKEICDKVAIMDKGNIIESGTVTDILLRPQTTESANFFSKVDIHTNNKAYRRAIKGEGTLVSAVFEGEKSVDPFISKMIKLYDVEASILLGNIQEINDTLIGHLVLKIKGDQDNISKGLKYLKNEGVIVEVISHGIN